MWVYFFFHSYMFKNKNYKKKIARLSTNRSARKAKNFYAFFLTAFEKFIEKGSHTLGRHFRPASRAAVVFSFFYFLYLAVDTALKKYNPYMLKDGCWLFKTYRRRRSHSNLDENYLCKNLVFWYRKNEREKKMEI